MRQIPLKIISELGDLLYVQGNNGVGIYNRRTGEFEVQLEGKEPQHFDNLAEYEAKHSVEFLFLTAEQFKAESRRRKNESREAALAREQKREEELRERAERREERERQREERKAEERAERRRNVPKYQHYGRDYSGFRDSLDFEALDDQYVYHGEEVGLRDLYEPDDWVASLASGDMVMTSDGYFKR